MEFKDIVMKRYATKKFDKRIIPEEKVEELFEIIRYAPSSSNVQPWKIKVITDQKTKELLSPVSWNQPQITTCSHLLVFCADTDLGRRIDMLIRILPQARDYYLGLKKTIDAQTPEQRLSWAQRQTFLALGNALNGAKSLGFDSCPMEGFDPKEYSRILDLPKELVPTALCTIGYAADTPRPKVRFERKDVFL